MGTIIHNGNSQMIILPFKIKKKCRMKHAKEDADMCGECIRLNNIDPFPDGKKKKQKSRKNNSKR